MKLLFKYLKRYRATLYLALFLAAVNQFFSLLDPQIFRLMIDRFATRIGEMPTSEFVRGVGLLLLGSVAVAFVSRVAKNFQDYFVNVITQKLGAALYADSVAHSFSLPYAVFEDQRSGELLSRLQKARTDAQAFITGMVNTVFFSLVGVLFVLMYAFASDWRIGLSYFLIIPVLGGAVFVIGKKIKEAQRRIVSESAELAGSTTETLRNVELVKSLGLENQETSRLNGVNKGILDLELKKVRLIRTLMFYQGTMVNAMRSLILFLMFYLIYVHAITLGQFFSLMFYSFFLFNPLQDLGTVSSQYQEAKASMESLEGILNLPLEPKPKEPKKIGTLQEIVFENVDFEYAASDRPTLSELSLTLKSGQSIAFVGPSGSGKTTIIKMIVGLYRPKSGKIRINGVDSETLDYEDFRKRIGYVSQETQLFAGTIEENLKFVRPDATREECLGAVRAAAAENILTRAETGLDTKIGEGGIKLSGGERQRLAIARALLRNPELIILDEATSSLDSITEKEITETIKKISTERPNLTVILVAHRLSTVAHADAIAVLEKGRIAEQGTHSELLKKSNGLYAALWREQQSV